MARGKKPSFDTVMAFMSPDTQDSIAAEGVSTLPLKIIRPDPEQPRQLLPIELAQAVDAGEMSPQEAVLTWMEQAKKEHGDTAGQARELRRLADSISQHGLINPITVRQLGEGETFPANAQYLIVTGERRYWSHVLLDAENRQIQEGETTKTPAQIKAVVAAQGISVRSHQMIENLMREDINALEKAMGLWALRYELSGVAHGSPPDDVQLVAWPVVEKTLGVSKRHRIRLIAVLKLSDDAQFFVAQYGLSERAIRPIIEKLHKYPDLQIKALQQLIAWQQDKEGPGEAMSVAVNRLVEQMLAREERRQAVPAEQSPTLTALQFQKQVRGTLNYLGKMGEMNRRVLPDVLMQAETYEETLGMLQSLQGEIETLINTLVEDRPE